MVVDDLGSYPANQKLLLVESPDRQAGIELVKFLQAEHRNMRF
jgi:hypothetical protein